MTEPSTKPLEELDATAQAALVASGEVSASELVEAAIDRIERTNPELNAVIHPLFEKARGQVAAGDLPAGPFRGVPFLVKDAVCQTAGDPYHAGMRFLKNRGYVARADTELARRFRAAGLVFVGKTNTPELAMSASTEPLAYGATRNPWNPAHSAGGSSGGSAAAVAAGLVPLAHANDMGGSIRIPASFCGLVGLKPTRARGTLAPEFGEFWGPLTHEHVVARSCRDTAGVLDCIAGAASGDPYTAPPPARPFREEVDAAPGTLRIGLLAGHAVSDLHPDVAAGLERVVALLDELGHRVAPMTLDAIERLEVGPWIVCGLARDLDRWAEVLGEPVPEEEVEPLNWMLAAAGRAMSGVEYVAASERAFRWARELQELWSPQHSENDRLDVLLMPTAPDPPPELGQLAPTVPPSELLARLGRVTRFTMPWNITGQPAISLPLHSSAEGLPIGMQFVGAYGREDVLLRLAAQLEAACPWASRRPTIHA